MSNDINELAENRNFYMTDETKDAVRIKRERLLLELMSDPSAIIRNRAKAIRSELWGLKHQRLRLKFRLARIHLFRFLLSVVYLIARAGFDVFDFLKKLQIRIR